MPKRLHEDHANARLMAEAVAAVDGVWCDLDSVQTNIVFFTLLAGGAQEFVAGMKAKGVLCSAIGLDQVRLVTHYDVSREDCERAVQLLKAGAVIKPPQLRINGNKKPLSPHIS